MKYFAPSITKAASLQLAALLLLFSADAIAAGLAKMPAAGDLEK